MFVRFIRIGKTVMSNPKRITVNFKNAAQLAEYYLPFFKNGGIFFATNYAFKLHDPITLRLTLPDGDMSPIEVEGHIAFINPSENAQSNNTISKQGAAVALSKSHDFLNTRINALLRMHKATEHN